MGAMDYILSAIIGLLASLLASVVFLFFLRRLRPKIVISDKIARQQVDDLYIIKIVNKGKRSVVNIKVRLQLIEAINVSGGSVYSIIDIPVAGENPLSIPGFDRKDRDANYAHRFAVYGLEKSWKDDTHTYLKFGIFCIDPLSGFGQVFTQPYSLKRADLKDGDFKFGDSLDIV